MNNLTYFKKEECPVCNGQFFSVKIKYAKLRKKSMDSDFFTHYEEGVYPFFYDVTICPLCGYAALDEYFHNIGYVTAKKVKEEMAKVWKEVKLPVGYAPVHAEFLYKMALYTAQIKKDKPSIIGRLCHRLAWVYRITGNKNEENKYLKHAINYYQMAVENEKIIETYKYFYLIGELYSLIGEHENASKWLQAVIMDRQVPESSLVKKMARNSWEKIREMYKTDCFDQKNQ